MTAADPTPRLATTELSLLVTDIDHGEGICFSPDGHLYVGGEAGQLYRIEEQGRTTQVLTTGGSLLGLAADGYGDIYACDHAHRCVWRIDPRSAEVREFSRGTTEAPMSVPNWGAFGPDGTYYVTDSGGWKKNDGRIYAVSPIGKTSLWTEETRSFPNGCAVAADGSGLWLVESNAAVLVFVPIRADGSAGPRQVVAGLPGTVPDGVALADDESILIACFRPDRILEWRRDYGVRVLVEDPEGALLSAPTNVAFFGADLLDAAVPNIGARSVTHFRPGSRGVPLFQPKW